MSSIVYVTDRNMIEFHRLNGSETLNFWRPMSKKKIRDFHPGDLIFFLTRVKERGTGNEKGIVGYGRYTKMNNMTFEQMWKRYKQENGFSTKEELKNAIASFNVNKEIPKMLNCLYITDVLFFSRPIYLSKIGLNVPSNIESFMYLDSGDREDVTYQLLEKAKEVGIDVWTAAINNKSINVVKFEEDLALHKASIIHREIEDFSYTETEERKVNALIKKMMSRDRKLQKLKYSNYEIMKREKEKIIIYIPALVSVKETTRLKQLIGHIEMWKALIDDDGWKIVVLTSEAVKDKVEPYLYDSRITFEIE